MRVRSGRFIAVLLMAGYALAAGNASPGRVQWHAEVCSAPPCGCEVRSFSSCEPTMTSADFCPITPHVTARRAVPMSNWGWGWGFARLKLAQPTQLSAWFASGTARPSRYSVAALSPHAGQIALQAASGQWPDPSPGINSPFGLFKSGLSPGRCANCQCTSAAFTVGCVPVGFAAMCHRQQHPSALTMRFLSVASHLLHSGFLQTMPRDIALAFGSWLSLLTMSPSRYSHRGLSPHKFAPMLGARH